MNIVTDLVNWYQTKQVESTIEIVIAIAIIVASYLLSSIFSYLIIKIFNTKEKNKKIKKNAFYIPIKIFFILLGFYIAILILKLPDSALVIVRRLFKVGIICLIAKGISNIASMDSILFTRLKKNEQFKENESTLKFISKAVKVIVYVIAAFVILAEFGYNLNGIIAGLGLSSVVIALAAQDIAKNLFSGLMIFMDRPFSIGDFIEVKNYQGTVEDIKFRSTKLRLLNNSILTLPNEIITTETITNWSKISKRRYETNLVLMLNTDMNKVEELIEKMKATLENKENVIPGSVEVSFNKIVDDGINILIYLYTDKTDYSEYLKFIQMVNLEIMNLIEQEKVGLAYKSQDIYIKS